MISREGVAQGAGPGKQGMARMQQRLERAEEEIAHLSRTVEDLSDMVAVQARQIAALERKLGLLMQREAEREYESGGTIPLADQRPPHW